MICYEATKCRKLKASWARTLTRALGSVLMIAFAGSVVSAGEKAHVSEIKLHSKSSNDDPDLHGPTDIEVHLAFTDDQGALFNVTVPFTIPAGQTPNQSAEQLCAAIKAAVAAAEVPADEYEVTSSGTAITVKGVDLANSEGTNGDAAKSPAPPPDPEQGDHPWVSTNSYDRSQPPPDM